MLSNGKDHFSLIRPEFSGPALTKRAVAQLGRVCATGMYCYTGHVKFQTGIFAEWKAHLSTGRPGLPGGNWGSATLTPFQS